MNRTWNWPQFTLAMLALAGLLAITIVEQWYGKMADAGSKQIIIGFATLAFAFFFQSSAGSKAKDDTIASLATSNGTGNGNGKPPAKVEVVNTPDKPANVTEQPPGPRGPGVGFGNQGTG